MSNAHPHEHEHPHARKLIGHHPHPEPHEAGVLPDGRRHHHPVADVPPPPELVPGEPVPVTKPAGLELVTTYRELVAAIADGSRLLDLDGEFVMEGRYGVVVPSSTGLWINARSDVRPLNDEVGSAFRCERGGEPATDVAIVGYGGLAPIHDFRGFLDPKGRPTGRGIIAGARSLIRNVEVYGCAENGVGGGSTHGTRLEHAKLHHNGSKDTTGHAAAGLKWANMDDASVAYVVAEANVGNGIWVDVGARAFTCEHTHAIGNSRKGYHYEISYGPALYEDCLAAENGWAEGRIRSDGGFVIVSSQDVTYRRCTSSHNVNGNGFKISDDSRPPVTERVTIEPDCQTLDGDRIVR